MTNISAKFIDALDRQYTAITPATLDHARKAFIDYVAVGIGGAAVLAPDFKAKMEQFAGEYYIFGEKKGAQLFPSVLYNSYASHVLELDDGHRAAMMHMGSPIFSALLGIAIDKGISFGAFLKSAVIGYEAAIRLAEVLQPEHKKAGFHATGTCGTIGAACALAYMLGYPRDKKLNTLSAACTSAAGLLEVIMGVSQQKPYNIANAAVSAVQAAEFGCLFPGPDDILGGKRGFIYNFCKDPDFEKLLADGDAKILGIYFKPYAACRHCHAPIEAAIKCAERKFNAQEIESVHVSTYGLAVYGHDHKEIDSINSAKMSIPYGVAIGLIYGECGMEMFTSDMISNPDVMAVAAKVEVSEDPELSKLVPNKRAAIIDVRLADGETLHYRTDYPLGEPENPISMDALHDKFISLISLDKHYDKATSTEIFNYLVCADYATGMNELMTTIKK